MLSEIFPKLSTSLSTAIETGNKLYQTRQSQIDEIIDVESKLGALIFNIPRTADRDRILRVAAKPRQK